LTMSIVGRFEILEYCPEIENCIDVGRSLMLLTP